MNRNILIKDILAALPSDPGTLYETERCSVYIREGGICGINEEPAGFSPETVLDGAGRLLIPGLVNSHTHAYMTIFRNFADDLKFHDWLFGKILPLEARLTAEDCYWGTMLGIMEMLRTGTTCFLDMYIFSDAAARAVSDSGIRAVLSRGLSGGRDDPACAEKKLKEALAEISRWRGKDNLGFMLAPHAPYTCDPGYLREIAGLARELGVGLHTHISESEREVLEIEEKYGVSPVRHMDNCGILGERTVAAHCVHLSAEDIELLASRGVSVATNPISNLKLANGVAPVPKMLEAGINVCIGTDGAASNNSLNLFRDIGLVTVLHKGISGDPQLVSAREGIRFATTGGARALGLEGVVGEIKIGERADLTIINLDVPNMQPVNEPISALAYSATGNEVETVMVNGNILFHQGRYKTIDAERVIYEVERVCERIGMRGQGA